MQENQQSTPHKEVSTRRGALRHGRRKLQTDSSTLAPAVTMLAGKRSSRALTRAEVRGLRERKRRVTLTAQGALAVLALGAFGWGVNALASDNQPAAAAALLPYETTSYQEIHFGATSHRDSYQRISDMLKANGQPSASGEQTYLQRFADTVNQTITFAQGKDWLSGNVAIATTKDHGEVILVDITADAQARKFMESSACLESMFKQYCAQDQHRIENGWLAMGDVSYLDQEGFEERNLSTNAQFVSQFTEPSFTRKGAFLGAWTSFGNVSQLLPMDLERSMPNNNITTLYVSESSTGISMEGMLYPSADEKHSLFSKEPDADLILDLPANSVTALAGTGLGQTLTEIANDEGSFINKDESWKAFVEALGRWGVKPGDQAQTALGKATAFSLNKGTLGYYGIAGTMRLEGADQEQIKALFTKAAEEDPNILNFYRLSTQGEDTLIIESQEPIVDGTLRDNANAMRLMGDGLEDSILAGYINFDATRDLLDSEYTAPTDRYDIGAAGINFGQRDGIVDYTLNWDFIGEPEPAIGTGEDMQETGEAQ